MSIQPYIVSEGDNPWQRALIRYLFMVLQSKDLICRWDSRVSSRVVWSELRECLVVTLCALQGINWKRNTVGKKKTLLTKAPCRVKSHLCQTWIWIDHSVCAFILYMFLCSWNSTNIVKCSCADRTCRGSVEHCGRTEKKEKTKKTNCKM